MAYFMTDATASWGAPKRAFLDADTGEPFYNLPYANPDEVNLTAPETEHKYTIGHGYRVIGDRAPKKALWQTRKPEYAITDIASILGQTVVSEKFRLLVEKYEPGVHQFIPVDIYDNVGGGAGFLAPLLVERVPSKRLCRSCPVEIRMEDRLLRSNRLLG